MLKRILAAIVLLLCSHAHAELPDDYRVVLLTENFPPFSMAEDNKNYAADAKIHGINADIVREMFRRANIRYELSLRFPWDRIYKQVLEQPDQGLFSTTFTAEREPRFKWSRAPGEHQLGAAGASGQLSAADRVGTGTQPAHRCIQERRGEPASGAPGAGADQFAARPGEHRQAAQGQIDVWATADPVGPYLAKQEGVTGLKPVLRFNEARLFLALNRATPDEVVERLQRALDAMRADGTVDGMLRRYL